MPGCLDEAAIAAAGRRGVQSPGDLDATAEQLDHSLVLAERGGADDAAVVDGAVGQATGGVGAHQDPTTVGGYEVPVVDQAGDIGPVDADFDQPVAGKVDAQFLTAGQRDSAQSGGDDAFVSDFRCEEGDVAAVGGGQRALVDDAAGTLLREAVVAAHEIVVAEPEAGGQQAADIDAGGGAEKDAAGVEQPDLAVGGEATVDDRASAVGADAVEYYRRGGRLLEAYRGVAADIEASPVDDGPGGCLVDTHAAARLTDHGTAGSDDAAAG